MASWPALPSRAAYLALHNASRRNALSLSILRDLRAQLHAHNTSPVDGKLRILPPFTPSLLPKLEAAVAADGNHHHPDPDIDQYAWLVSPARWRTDRAGLPNVIVLRSSGPVFCAGHDLAELSSLPPAQVAETFALCAEVMALIRRSPAPVVGVVQGLATAAGAQLALTTDVPIALRGTVVRLPGAGLGLPCTSPGTAVSRRVGNAVAARMVLVGEGVRVEELGGVVDVVDVPATAAAAAGEEGTTSGAAGGGAQERLEQRVKEVVELLAEQTAPQPQALGKWAFWTQVGLQGDGDGYEEAVRWTGRVMALHARSEDAREGMAAFLGKRKPVWKL